MAEKPTDTVLEVQDGIIDIQLIINHINKNLPKIVAEKEKNNGQVSR